MRHSPRAVLPAALSGVLAVVSGCCVWVGVLCPASLLPSWP